MEIQIAKEGVPLAEVNIQNIIHLD